MFGIGAGELFVIAVLVLIAVGPNRMPTLLRSVFKAYRQFRQATRDLRASTGIDEILQDEDLAALRKPLHIPPVTATEAAAKPPKKRALAYNDRVRELPPEGVDLEHIRELESRPSEEEAQRIIAAKVAASGPTELSPEAEAIRNAKIAAAGGEDAIRNAKIAAAGGEDAIRNAKIAAAGGEDAIRNAKIAAVENAKAGVASPASEHAEDEGEPEPKRAGKGG